MTTPFRRATAALLLLAGLLLAGFLWAGPASAARSDTKTKPVVLVHGLSLTGGTAGYNCGTYWANAISVLRGQGFTGPMVTWGYYLGDSNCTGNFGGTTNTDLHAVAQQFAWYIWTNYTSKGKVVDVMAHSMGGLIVRAAISGVQRHQAGFPDHLYIEDAVTLATPHGGALLAYPCDSVLHLLQCQQLKVHSAFMNDLRANAQNPQGANGGTDWSELGSPDDELVPLGYDAMTAGHRYRYDNVLHNAIKDRTTGTYAVDWWHTYPTVRSGHTAAERAPLYTAAQALYLSSW